ncbi:3-methyl-2-oxobutanoate hydroxymethyltransferase [bacterium]|nr:3-methyl-2-oxobutanoate hydroxymethyltransferase [bacterium]
MTSPEKISLLTVRSCKAPEGHLCAVTAYDYTFARLVDQAGVDIVLCGDSLANTMLGLESTVPLTLDQMVHHSTAVARGVQRAFCVADMPFGSVQTGVNDALANCVRVFKECGVDAVKIEGGIRSAEVIRAVVGAGIPVMGHVGLTPQFRSMLGGLKVQGKDEESARRILADARAVEEAGAFAVVLEAVPRRLAALITSRLNIPTIGIGAGPDCDGQILVLHDILGLSPRAPKFAKVFADLPAEVLRGVQAYCDEVRSGAFPDDSHSFRVDDSIIEKL